MYVLALATDYDETIADEGIVSETTQATLRRLKETGRKLILVTGRELVDLEAHRGQVFYAPLAMRFCAWRHTTRSMK